MSDVIKIPNISNYRMDIVNNTLILTPKKTLVTEGELKDISLSYSKIIKCIIKNKNIIITKKHKYRQILIDIWLSMPLQKIIQNTSFNIKLTDKNGLNGYFFENKLGFSFQSKDATMTFNEIITMVKLNNYQINIIIKLKDNKIIQYKNYD